MQRLAIYPNCLSDRGEISLTVEQGRYLYRVLRLKAGDRFVALLGMPHGGERQWVAELGPAADAIARLVEPVPVVGVRRPAIALLAAPPKGSAFDEVVRQAVELGARWIVPVLSDRTVLQPGVNKVERWRRIALEAMEQCERTDVPEVLAPVATDALADCLSQVESTARRGQRWLCVARDWPVHLLDAAEAAAAAADCPKAEGLVWTVAIGPEGGWSDRERRQLQTPEFGFEAVGLGDRVLRAATAPLAALTLMAAVWERDPARASRAAAIAPLPAGPDIPPTPCIAP